MFDIAWKQRSLLLRIGRAIWRNGFFPFALVYGLSKDIFNLAVHTAQLGLRPAFQVIPERWIHAQQK